jgi:hypothetical protein
VEITQILVVVIGILGLLTAIINVRTAYRKNHTESSATQVMPKAKGPFDDMLSYMGMFGMAFVPKIVILLVSGLSKLVAAIPNVTQREEPPRQKQLQQAQQPVTQQFGLTVDSIGADNAYQYYLGEAAASMSNVSSRDSALRHAVDLVIKEREFQVALLAASRMALVSGHDETLALVAKSAITAGHPKITIKAGKQISSMSEHDETMSEVMKALDQPPKKSIMAAP